MHVIKKKVQFVSKEINVKNNLKVSWEPMNPSKNTLLVAAVIIFMFNV